MRTFIGLIFLMGIIYKPSIPMYWSTDELYHTPIFHCNDNNNPQYDGSDKNRDRLYKVQPLMTCCVLDAKQFIHLVKRIIANGRVFILS